MEKAYIILTKSPYGRVFSVEGIRLASGLAAMDIPTTMLFLGESIYSLHKNQDASKLEMPDLMGGFDILEMSEVGVNVVDEDLAARAMVEDDLVDYPFLEVITKEEMTKRIAESDCSFRF